MAKSTPWIILAVVGGGVVVDQIKRARTGYGLFSPSRADDADDVVPQLDVVAATDPVPAGPENVGGTLRDILDTALGLVRGVGDIFRSEDEDVFRRPEDEDVFRILPRGVRRVTNGRFSPDIRRVRGVRRVTNGRFSPDIRRVPGSGRRIGRGGRVGRPVDRARLRHLRRSIRIAPRL